MKKLFSILFIFVALISSAQYADSGTGGLKNYIWWFDWNNFTITNGGSKTFTTTDGMTVTVTFSNVSSPPSPNVMNTWPGAVLHNLYNFTNATIKPALLTNVTNSTLSRFLLSIRATRGGAPTPFTLVAADAEASSTLEKISLQTNGSNWTTYEFFRNSSQTSNPLNGCGTQSAIISDTWTITAPSGYGQNPLIATNSPRSGPLEVNVSMERSEYGASAVAFGIFSPIDRGDLPASYGYANHRLIFTNTNGCNYLPPLPSIVQSEALKLGKVAGDADAAETSDDNQSGADEDGVSSFPIYTGNGTYSVNVTLQNTTDGDAFLTGWFDYNRDGIFDSGESVTTTIPQNATSSTLTWIGLPLMLPTGTATNFGFRFRLSSDKSALQTPIGPAPDGEVEDYLVPPPTCQVTTISDKVICPGESVALNTTGADAYKWSPSIGLSNPNISSPVASPVTSTQYIVTGTTIGGCLKKDTVNVNVYAKPAIIISKDTVVCKNTSAQLSITGGNSYRWSPLATLSNHLIANPIASPVTNTMYYVAIKDANSCEHIDSVQVSVKPDAVFSITNPGKLCQNDSLQLNASGGNIYSWQPAQGLSNAGISNPIAFPSVNTDYTVTITETTCNESKTLSTRLTILPLPIVSTAKSNDIDCSNDQSQLTATGANKYVWTPSETLNNPGIYNPVATPRTPTEYIVEGTDMEGCKGYDTITVKVDNVNKSGYLMPNAFTPNNDGLNDCYGVKYWGVIHDFEFSVYNRWGDRLFFTKDPRQCWDGTYKGVKQDGGVYVYMVKAKTTCEPEVFRKGTFVLVR